MSWFQDGGLWGESRGMNRRPQGRGESAKIAEISKIAKAGWGGREDEFARIRKMFHVEHWPNGGWEVTRASRTCRKK